MLAAPTWVVDRVRQVVDAANELRSDLTVVLGDFFATHHFVTERVPHPVWAAELARPARAARRLHDPRQSRLVVRHRRRAARAWILCGFPSWKTKRFCWGLRATGSGWRALATRSPIGSARARFEGVDDLPGTLAHVRTDDPVILLAHEPDIFTEVPARVALTIAGHTHGGQIRLPMLPPVWAPSAYGARFAYGHIVENGRHMVVSGGLGCSKVPLRLGVPPEIVRITLGPSAKTKTAPEGAVFNSIALKLQRNTDRRPTPRAD